MYLTFFQMGLQFKQLLSYFYFNLDMIDQVLGFNRPAAVRRKRADNASESSSKQEVSIPTTVSPARPAQKRLNTQEPVQANREEDQRVEAPPPSITNSSSRVKPKSNITKTDSKIEAQSDQPQPQPQTRIQPQVSSRPQPQRQSQPTQSKPQPQSNPSPAPKSKPTSKPKQQKSQSQQQISSPAINKLGIAKFAKLPQQMRTSGVRTMKESIRPELVSQGNDMSYKLKLLAFLVLSVLLTLYVMTPNSKCSSRRR